MASNKIKMVIHKGTLSDRTRVIHIKRSKFHETMKKIMGDKYDPSVYDGYHIELPPGYHYGKKEPKKIINTENLVDKPIKMGEMVSGINKGLNRLFNVDRV